MSQPLFVLPLLLASFAALAGDAAIEYRCPERITTVQALAQPLPGWRPSVEPPYPESAEISKGQSVHFLDTVAFSAGVPEERGWLVPDNESKLTGKAWTARWEFAASEEIWVSCQYRQTALMISKQLPAGIKRCSLRFDATKGIQVQRVWCDKR